MNLILIGYRCTGKTSVGKKLAEKLAIPFYDTDHILTDRFGKTIQEWVAEKGWPSFRQEEKTVIREIASLDSSVIALGGGAVLDPENRETLRNKGLIVWLTADVQTIIERMNTDPNNKDFRPHLSEKDWESEIQTTLTERLPIYERMADFVIDTKGKGLEEVTEEIDLKIEPLAKIKFQ
jgi:shikimate kinase